MQSYVELSALGWSPIWQLALDELNCPQLRPARITAQHRDLYELQSAVGAATATVSGKLRHTAGLAVDLPAVGDWVAIEPYPREPKATIHAVLPRRTAFVRKVAGGVLAEQVVAANIDTALLIGGLDDNFNPRRMERYLTLAHEAGAMPVIVLNKVDLQPAAAARAELRRTVERLAPGVPVVLLSARSGEGLAELRDFLPPRETAVLLGSSGVGKSTVVNALCGGERMSTAAVSGHNSLGRHTTTHRELLLLPHGAVLIDTPGMRELQLWGDENSLARSFAEIDELFLQCRFPDCTHRTEPGCAVLAALADGSLEPERWAGYLKQQRELRFLAGKTDKQIRGENRKRFQKMMREGHEGAWYKRDRD